MDEHCGGRRYATFGDALPLKTSLKPRRRRLTRERSRAVLADALDWSTASAEQWSAALSGHSSARGRLQSGGAEGQTKEDAFNAALAACGSEQERSAHHRDAHGLVRRSR